MTTISTHVLDTALGIPAVGIKVTLSRTAWDGLDEPIGGGTTDADGRVRALVEPGITLGRGVHRLRFEVEEYFATTGRAAFYPRVDVSFVIGDEGHYHVPLLLSPFGYSTYRGS